MLVNSDLSQACRDEFREIHDDVIKWKHYSALLALCAGKSLVIGEFPSQRPVTRSFDMFFDLCLNKRLIKQSWGWWCETPSQSSCRHYSVKSLLIHYQTDWPYLDITCWNGASFQCKDNFPGITMSVLNTRILWGRITQVRRYLVSAAWISNYTPQNCVACRHSLMP